MFTYNITIQKQICSPQTKIYEFQDSGIRNAVFKDIYGPSKKQASLNGREGKEWLIG
jgi:hypothetical protein